MSDQDNQVASRRAAPHGGRLLLGGGPPRALPDDEAREQEEWEKDQLVRLMGWDLSRSPDSALNQAPAFLELLARDLRDRPSCDGLPPARMVELRERIRRRALAAPAGVRCANGRAPERRASVVAPFQQAARAAAEERCAPSADLAIAAGRGRELWDEPCETWVELPPDAPAGRYVALRVAGESMTPLLHPDDTVLVRLGVAPAPGAVVVARVPDEGYVVKRVGAVRRETLELLSLNPEFPPRRIPRGERAVLGRVVQCWCGHRTRAGG